MKKTIKLILVVACALVCGILYSCSRTKQMDLDSQGTIDMCTMEESGTQVMTEPVSEAPEPEESGVDDADRMPETEAKCYVYVCGAVLSPGVYEVGSDARIVDAIEMADGFSDDADRDYLNLAGMICDGMKIYVPTEKEVRDGYDEVPVAVTTTDTQNPNPAGDSVNAKININTADETELMKLNGVGKSRAGDIIEYRNTHGKFEKIEDIMLVPGIKDGMYGKIKDDIEV